MKTWHPRCRGCGPAGLVGRGNTLSWSFPADLRWFHFASVGRPVIVGCSTFNSLPSLPGRQVLMLSSTAPPGCAGWWTDPVKLLDVARDAALPTGVEVQQTRKRPPLVQDWPRMNRDNRDARAAYRCS